MLINVLKRSDYKFKLNTCASFYELPYVEKVMKMQENCRQNGSTRTVLMTWIKSKSKGWKDEKIGNLVNLNVKKRTSTVTLGPPGASRIPILQK